MRLFFHTSCSLMQWEFVFTENCNKFRKSMAHVQVYELSKCAGSKILYLENYYLEKFHIENAKFLNARSYLLVEFSSQENDK